MPVIYYTPIEPIIYDDDGIPVMPADAEMYPCASRDFGGYRPVVSVIGATDQIHRMMIHPITHHRTRAAADAVAAEWLATGDHRHQVWDYAHTNDAWLRVKRSVARQQAQEETSCQ